jgi:hypothetical protein
MFIYNMFLLTTEKNEKFIISPDKVDYIQNLGGGEVKVRFSSGFAVVGNVNKNKLREVMESLDK